jgi:hypothetical protein
MSILAWQVGGKIERGNGPFKAGLQAWMRGMKLKGVANPPWGSIGIYIVCGQIMRRRHYSRGESPYVMLYGRRHRTELCATIEGLDRTVLQQVVHPHSLVPGLVPVALFALCHPLTFLSAPSHH